MVRGEPNRLERRERRGGESDPKMMGDQPRRLTDRLLHCLSGQSTEIAGWCLATCAADTETALGIEWVDAPSERNDKVCSCHTMKSSYPPFMFCKKLLNRRNLCNGAPYLEPRVYDSK